MSATDIISLLGGIALFLYGMSVMGDNLKKVAGGKLEVTLYRLTGSTPKAILLGAGVTAVIQSSSATSVMVVGFVNSRMMKIRQGIGIILGAVIGTSVTGWILCLSDLGGSGIGKFLSTTVITAIIALIGILLQKIAKKRTTKSLGVIFLGLAVLLYGMSAMSGAVSGLKESEEFVSLLTKFSNPILSILVGTVLTAILQSASAAVGILQALAVTGAISFDIALPLVMGIAIGACVPVLMSALGASTDGKRTAWSFLCINTLGVIIGCVVWYPLNAIIHFGFNDMIMTSMSIAALNSIFRICYVLILSPFTKQIEKLVCKLIRDKTVIEEDDEDDTEKLEERFLQHPALAIEGCKLVTASMAKKAQKNILKAMSLCINFDNEKFEKVNYREDIIDRYEDKLGTYLMKITSKSLSKEQRDNVAKYLHCITDFERISDHAVNVADLGLEISEKSIHFSGEAKLELEMLIGSIAEILDNAVSSFINSDIHTAAKVEPLEEVIDELCDKMKLNHVERLTRGECTLAQGFVFNDLLNNAERVADHCSNIAVAVIETTKDDFETHKYLNSTEYKQSPEFIRLFEQYNERYAIK